MPPELPGRAPRLLPEELTIQKELLSPIAGGELVRRVVELAQERSYSGMAFAYNAVGEQLSSQAVGNGAHANQQEIIRAKLLTVLATRRSVSMQIKYMTANNRTREDYGGALGSLISGGVAVFKDAYHTIFLGSLGFGGARAEQDEEICRLAIEDTGLYTDLPSPIEVSTQPLIKH